METSYYERLSIYKSAMDLMVKVDNVVRAFPRYHKYAIGARLRDESIEIVQRVIQANRKELRGQKIVELCEHVEQMKFLCNAAKEMNAWKSFKQFMQIMEQVVNVARQAEGWRKSVPSNRPEP